MRRKRLTRRRKSQKRQEMAEGIVRLWTDHTEIHGERNEVLAMKDIPEIRDPSGMMIGTGKKGGVGLECQNAVPANLYS